MNRQPLASIYAQLIGELSGSIRAQWAWPSPEAGFATLVFHKTPGEKPLPELDPWPIDDRLVHSPSLAAAGYAMFCGHGEEHKSAWFAGIDRLRGREPFPSDRQSFAYRPIELLGLAAGISKYQSDDFEVAKWMRQVLARSRKEHADDSWAAGLQYAAELTMGVSGGRSPTAQDCPRVDELALLQWLSKQFLLPADTSTVTRKLLEQSAIEPLGYVDLPRASIIYQSLREAVRDTIESNVEHNWQIGRESKDAETLIVNLCRRFHLFAEQLKMRHDNRTTVNVTDEYDVQDLLHALLKLHFDDVRPEEVTPSVAGKSGRMDFLLKHEKVVVEVKMTRKGLDQKKVGDELIIDMRRYQAHPDVRTLICLVYDPGKYCHAPAALENDLTGVQGHLRTVVVVCPKGL